MTVSATVIDDMLAVTVSDTGVGIPEDKFETVFQSFEQVDASMTRSSRGYRAGVADYQAVGRVTWRYDLSGIEARAGDRYHLQPYRSIRGRSKAKTWPPSRPSFPSILGFIAG